MKDNGSQLRNGKEYPCAAEVSHVGRRMGDPLEFGRRLEAFTVLARGNITGAVLNLVFLHPTLASV